jgi:uncharacterized membrane protein YccC
VAAVFVTLFIQSGDPFFVALIVVVGFCVMR